MPAANYAPLVAMPSTSTSSTASRIRIGRGLAVVAAHDVAGLGHGGPELQNLVEVW